MSIRSAHARKPEASHEDELAFAGTARQADLLRERQVSAPELVALHLERIERIDSGLMPLSVQLIGKPYDESTLLSLAAHIEAERPWADLRPGVS